MCGFAGILSFDDRPIDPARLEAMRQHLAHRGPDGQGAWLHGHCALVHTRLSIIDILGGRQPMHVPAVDADHGPLCLVFNGEIYNHRTLRRQLEALGHRFSSDHCDTEVLLHGYRQWAGELPKRLHGMFAFAIYDPQRRELFLCRDRTGKKPLYLRRLGEGGAGELVFGSLAGAIHLAGPRTALHVDPSALHSYLSLGYCGEQSLLAGVQELPAAHSLLVDHGGCMRLQRYWQPPPVSRTSTPLGAADAVLEVLDEAVKARLEADVPLGCFLSGGIDSSLVAALAQRVLLAQGKGPLRTFSVAMPDLAYDESAKAREVAGHIGSVHECLVAHDGADVMADLSRLISLAGAPAADSSILPTYWLSRAARRYVKVALSGDGGDELFGGYDRYRAIAILTRHRHWLARLPTALGSRRSAHPRAWRHRLLRLIAAARQDHPASRYAAIVRIFSEPELAALAPSLSQAAADPPPLPDWPDETDPVKAAMIWDLRHYLPFDLLRKVDRASMAVALEVRCPLLDTAVCDLAGHLPASVLMPRGRAKGLLRQVAARFLPGRIVHQKKRGFAIPIGHWLRTSLAPPLRDHLLEGGLEELGLHRPAIATLIDEHATLRADHTHRLFSLLALALWWRWVKDPLSPSCLAA